MSVLISGKITTNSVSMGTPPAGFSPVSFWSGETGGFWNFADGANLFSDTSRTTPASVDGNVNGVTDLSGLGNHLTSSSAYPFTRKSGYCLADQGGAMISPTISMGYYTAFALIRTDTLGSLQNIVDSDYGTGNRVSQNIILHTSNVMQTYVFGYSSPSVLMPSPTLTTSTNYFAAVAVDNSSADLRIGGTTYNSGAGGSLAGGLAPVAIGASFGGTLTPQYQDFIGRIYCAAWIGKKCTAQEILDVGNYMVSLTGASATV
jgi:hypothetical protein